MTFMDEIWRVKLVYQFLQKQHHHGNINQLFTSELQQPGSTCWFPSIHSFLFRCSLCPLCLCLKLMFVGTLLFAFFSGSKSCPKMFPTDLSVQLSGQRITLTYPNLPLLPPETQTLCPLYKFVGVCQSHFLRVCLKIKKKGMTFTYRRKVNLCLMSISPKTNFLFQFVDVNLFPPNEWQLLIEDSMSDTKLPW